MYSGLKVCHRIYVCRNLGSDSSHCLGSNAKNLGRRPALHWGKGWSRGERSQAPCHRCCAVCCGLHTPWLLLRSLRGQGWCEEKKVRQPWCQVSVVGVFRGCRFYFERQLRLTCMQLRRGGRQSADRPRVKIGSSCVGDKTHQPRPLSRSNP